MAHVPEGMTLDQAEAYKNKKYLKVFYMLCAFTVLEVLPTFFEKSVPKIVLDTIIITFTAAKMYCVGYYFMHLEFESRWMKIVAMMPLMLLANAAVLMPDTVHDRSRAISHYIPEPARVLQLKHDAHEQAEMATEAEGHGEGEGGAHGEAAEAKSVTVDATQVDTETAERLAGNKVVEALKAQAEVRRSKPTSTGGETTTDASQDPAEAQKASGQDASGSDSDVDQWR